jgi:hypothetical protein
MIANYNYTIVQYFVKAIFSHNAFVPPTRRQLATDDPLCQGAYVVGSQAGRRLDPTKAKRSKGLLGRLSSQIRQLLKSRDPQISMLRRFADAMGVALTTIVRE